MQGAKKWLLTVCVGLLAFASMAKDVTKELTSLRTPKSKAVVLGKWHAGFEKCKKYADSHGVPLIAVWSNGQNCGHCITFEDACLSTQFKNWMKGSGCVFFFVTGDDADGKRGGDGFNFAKGVSYGGKKNPYGIFPYVRVYWYVNGKKKLDITTSGDYIDGSQRGSTGGKKAVDWFKDKLKKYKYSPTPPKPKYTGGEFGVDDSENSRLEVEIGNLKDVTLPLTRTNSVAAASVSTNTVVAVYPDGHAETNVVNWAANDDTANVVFTAGSLASLENAGDQVTIFMLDATGKAVATNHITAVEPPENSPKNPLWIGEKSSDELNWGEWTMDIDAATNKVKAFNAGLSLPPQSGLSIMTEPSRAYTLVLVGGSLWCPDCFRAEEYLFDTDDFKAWATNRQVACVAIDEPRFGGKTPTPDRPTLLTRLGYKVSYNGVTNLTSGAGYLSRKGVSDAEAKRILDRNLGYVNNDKDHGGFCLTDNLSGSGNTFSWKTGIPCIIILRDDGSVAGRLFQFSNSTTMLKDTPNVASVLVNRLDELLAQVDDEREEDNDSRYTTAEMIGKRETIDDKTLSFTDAVDVYRIDPDTYGNRMKFSVTAKTAGTSMEVKVVRVSGSTTTVQASASGKLADDEYTMDVSANIPADTNLAWFVSVGYPTDSSYYPLYPDFALTNGESTVRSYSISSDFVVQPKETESGPYTNDTLSVSLVSNEMYRIVGIDAAANADILEPVEGQIFRALVTDDVTFERSGDEVRVQLWHPGKVGFATTSAFAAEPTEDYSTYNIRLVRTGGVSGTATATVAFNAERSSKLDMDTLIELPADFGEQLTWAEGESDEKTLTIKILGNPFADGDQAMFFDATCGGDAEAGITQFRLTLRDNDRKVSGRLAILETDPFMAKAMTTFARAGSDVVVTLGRIDGADGNLAATLETTDGTFDETEFAWPSRDASDKTATLTLPNEAGKRIKAALVPAKGTAVDSTCRILTVDLLPADAPGFVDDSVSIPATRYLPIDEMRVKLDDKADADTAAVKLFSGTLAKGLKWQFDKNAMELVISGVPDKAGQTTATFRVFNGDVAGMVTAVTVDVVDPVTSGAGERGDQPLNPAVANSRTFADMPVYDNSTNRLAGVLTLTLPRTGRASAKYRTPAGDVSLSAENWNGICDEGDDVGALSVVLTGSLGTNAYELAVVAKPDGSVTLDLDDPLCPDGVTVETSGTMWGSTDPATDFKGYYTVSLPQIAKARAGTVFAKGDGYVTLTMNNTLDINAGKMAYAGILPNGKPFSGSARLYARASDAADRAELGYWPYAVLPILVPGESDSLAGELRLTPGAYDKTALDLTDDYNYCGGRCYYKEIRRSVRLSDKCALTWRHVENGGVAACEAGLDAFGTYYNSAEDFANCCNSALGTTKLKFFSLGGFNDLPDEVRDELGKGLADGVANEAKTIANVNVTYAKATKTAKTKTNSIASANTKNLSLTFTLSTGVVSGTFKLPFKRGDSEATEVTLTYRGIVMPGWGSQECGACGAGGEEASLRPFISGVAWFNDTYSGKDEGGRESTCTVRRSCAISVGVNAGE